MYLVPYLLEVAHYLKATTGLRMVFQTLRIPKESQQSPSRTFLHMILKEYVSPHYNLLYCII